MARDDEAEPLLRRARTLFTRTLHDAHPHVRACRDHLAELRCRRPGERLLSTLPHPETLPQALQCVLEQAPTLLVIAHP
jgi:hypothetical protein